MAFVGFCHDLVRYEFPPICLRQAPSHRGALFIAHDVHARPAGLYLARILRQVFLILLRPSLGLLDSIFENFCDHDVQYITSCRPGNWPSAALRRSYRGASGTTMLRHM